MGAEFTPGNLLASTGDGLVREFTPEGAEVRALNTGAFQTAGSAFGLDGQLYVTTFSSNSVAEFDSSGDLLGTFGSGYNSDPESVVVDPSTGDVYVGQADGTRQVLKFAPNGELLTTFAPETEDRGTDWIALGADRCTLFYTSEDVAVKRFNVCTNSQLPDFATGLPYAHAYQVQLLPDGGLLVADGSAILRLDSSGHIVQEYSSGAIDDWFSVGFTPGGLGFWAGDLSTGKVVAFSLDSGAVLGEFDSSRYQLAGLTVIPGTPPPPNVTILSGPAKETASQRAIFTFRGAPGGTYECSIDRKAWMPCMSGEDFGPLEPGDHLFRVREMLDGVVGPAASYPWTITLPRKCILRVARARVFVFAHHRTVRLVIHYTTYRPAEVRVSYKLKGRGGDLALGGAKSHFKTAGVFRLPKRLTRSDIRKVRRAKLIKVRFKIPKTPKSCGRYYTKRLTIPKNIFGQTVWFQSDSIFR